MLLQHSELVDFDPAKKEHRQAVRDFMKRRAWADTHMRFSYDPAYGSVAEQVQSKLLSWYMFHEETRSKKKEEPVTSKKPSPKTMGVVSELRARRK